MKIQSRPIIFYSFLFVFLLFSLHSSSIAANEAEDEREFEYVGGEKGPKNWGKIKKEWAVCNNGDHQSPIDLSSRRVQVIPTLGHLKKSYTPSHATLKNRGHDISLYWDGNAGSITVNDVVYALQRCHWHSPSEHTINGRRYDLELHMVHVSQDPNVTNKIAVVGQVYRIGQPDPYLAQLSRHISSIADKNAEVKVGVVDPTKIMVSGRKYYRYLGSLTVPPCTEGVIWTVSKKVRTVSMEQVKLLRQAVYDFAEFNARPLQALNSREIHYYEPNSRN